MAFPPAVAFLAESRPGMNCEAQVFVPVLLLFFAEYEIALAFYARLDVIEISIVWLLVAPSLQVGPGQQSPTGIQAFVARPVDHQPRLTAMRLNVFFALGSQLKSQRQRLPLPFIAAGDQPERFLLDQAHKLLAAGALAVNIFMFKHVAILQSDRCASQFRTSLYPPVR